MDAGVLEAASVLWAGLSALAVILLGALALSGGRSRAPGSLALGGFAILWGLHVLASRWMAYVGPDLAPRAHLLYAALLLPTPYLILQFARGHANARHAAWRLTTGAAAAIALLAATLLALRPELLYEGATLFEGRVFPVWGPLYPALVILPFYGALGIALLALDGARRAAPTMRLATRHALVAAGLATFTAFSAGNNLAFYAIDASTLGRHVLALPYVTLFAALSLVALVVGLRAAREAALATERRAARASLLVALAALVPFAWGAAEGALAYWSLPRLNTVGLWRLLGVAMLAYAMVRWRLPELQPRSRETTATAVGVAAAATTGGLLTSAVLLLAPGAPLLTLAAVGVPLASLSPSIRLAHRVLGVSPDEDLGPATLPKRVETYRAALESSLARECLEEDATFLAALRERLGIGEDVHDALLAIARDTVLPPPDESHPGYERLRLLGEGAQARAWLARRRADDQLVVIKESKENDEASRRALAEQARIAQRVRHANLVHIHHAVDGAASTFLVMDHAAGGSLADRLARGPLPAATAVGCARDVLDGLAALHAAGYVHGDVKASNVLFDASGRARLADYGLSRAQPAAADVTRTLGGAAGAGTLAAMAPELVEGSAPSRAADIYATGALLYRLLTGEHYVALQGVAEAEARARVLREAPRLPHPRVPASVEPILRRALAKRPADRFPSAASMREALDEASKL